MEIILLYLLIFLISIVLIPFFRVKVKGIITIIAILLSSGISAYIAISALLGKTMEITFSGTLVTGEIPIRIDGLSAWFILLINFTFITGGLYGLQYMKAYRDQSANLSLHCVSYLMVQVALTTICVVQNSIVFLFAWEMMALGSFLLVIFENNKQDVIKAGINYLILAHVCIVFLYLSFIWVASQMHSFDFLAVGIFFNSNPNRWLFLLFFIGFGIKAGFVPLHSWLPHAHPAAPSHVSGVMSGVIVKIGIYGIIRFALMLKNDFTLIGESLLVLSILTGIFGILNAAVHRDFKKMLAYCTIENIGIIGIGIALMLIGMGMNNPVLIVLGLSGALLHTLNHSLFKSLLFFSSGSVYQQTHTRDMEKLGGLVHKMPQTAFLFLIGAIAIGGLPPLNGFVSEFIIYNGFLEGIHSTGFIHSTLMILSLAGLAIIGGLSLLTFTKSFGIIFLGRPREKNHHEPTEVSLMMRIPQYLIIGVMFSIGLFPQFYFSAMLHLIGPILPSALLPNLSVFEPTIVVMSEIGKYSMVFLLLLALVFFIRNYFTRTRPSRINATWASGYIRPSSKMQYTGKSFSKTLGKLLNFIAIEKKGYTEITTNEIFPESRKHTSHYIDFFENTILSRIKDRLLLGMNYFQFIQNGKIQMYVFYGLFFIMLVFLGTLFHII